MTMTLHFAFIFMQKYQIIVETVDVTFLWICSWHNC